MAGYHNEAHVPTVVLPGSTPETETQSTPAKICNKESTYYWGKCGAEQKCIDDCKTFENGETGYCLQGEGRVICICIYDCTKYKPQLPAPPKKGQPPSPPKSDNPMLPGQKNINCTQCAKPSML
ncbi:anther-specific protein SF2-like [Bidens hawaiensis]|uniref:anther-specific protein SF2-like n=1 Tax=Bidens hawaiensis TaxID=980011 RepID=UPI004049D12B